MDIISSLSTAANGLQTQARRANDAADRIVRQSTVDEAQSAALFQSERGSSDGAGLSIQLQAQEEADGLTGAIVDLIEAEVAYKASAEVLRSADELAQESIDLLS